MRHQWTNCFEQYVNNAGLISHLRQSTTRNSIRKNMIESKNNCELVASARQTHSVATVASYMGVQPDRTILMTFFECKTTSQCD